MIKYLYQSSKRDLISLRKNIIMKGRTPSSNNENYQRIGIMDPSIGTSNMGDYIIQDAIQKNILSIFPKAFVSQFPSQLSREVDSIRLMQNQEFILIGGTNLLASNMDSRFQWKVTPADSYFLANKMVLFGVGWWQYQDDPNKFTSKMLNSLLNKDYYHSVRDSYTLGKLKSIGVKNVLNTTCPTLWSLDEEKCASIPTVKAEDVVTTLTFYHKNHNDDAALLKLLLKNYRNVHVWIQGFEDLQYLNDIVEPTERIKIINPALKQYDQFLAETDADYVGTRLHAGVRALQFGRRTLIVAVDNRAVEISRDTNLNVIRREELSKATDFINGKYETNIKLPKEQIAIWKNQFYPQ